MYKFDALYLLTCVEFTEDIGRVDVHPQTYAAVYKMSHTDGTIYRRSETSGPPFSV